MSPQASTRSIVLFTLGAALMIGAVVLGKFFLPEVQQSTAALSTSLLRMPKVILFAFGFPLGVGLALWGAALWGEAVGARAWRFGMVAVAGPLVMLAIPKLAGTANSPAYFGIGGITLLLLFLLTLGLWGRYRASLSPQARSASDLQAIGYFCFALAAWNSCGVGGMPGFALYPDRMQQLETHFMAVVNLKAAMAFFVLGWLFTFLSFYRTWRSRQENIGGYDFQQINPVLAPLVERGGRCHHDPALKRRATVMPSLCDGGRRRGIGTDGGNRMASRCDRMRVTRRFNAGSPTD